MKLMCSILIMFAFGANSVAFALIHSADSPPGPMDSTNPNFESFSLPSGELPAPAVLEASWACTDSHPGTVGLSWSHEGGAEVNLAQGLNFTDSHAWTGTVPGEYHIWLRAGDAFGNFNIRESALLLSQVVAANDVPVEFSLQPAQPNPFNPSTVLRFSLPSTATASLVVYNLRGGHVLTLLEGLVAGGVHEVHVDAATWSSGIYMAVLESEGCSQIQKLVLVK